MGQVWLPAGASRKSFAPSGWSVRPDPAAGEGESRGRGVQAGFREGAIPFMDSRRRVSPGCVGFVRASGFCPALPAQRPPTGLVAFVEPPKQPEHEADNEEIDEHGLGAVMHESARQAGDHSSERPDRGERMLSSRRTGFQSLVRSRSPVVGGEATSGRPPAGWIHSWRARLCAGRGRHEGRASGIGENESALIPVPIPPASQGHPAGRLR